MSATMTPADLRLMLDVMMCLDPSPLDDEMDAALRQMLDRESVAHGYSDWIDAFHRHQDTRGISRCMQSGYHAYMAGPCFDKYEEAVAYRDATDRGEVRR